ncbi:MAG: NADH-quinone oxidoreductase subunit C [Armatimonadota bacterium]|nr:NADH-quinone oxidoreductase subunit C [Armatimonadota bacterium]
MTAEQVSESVRARIGDALLECTPAGERRLYLTIEPHALADATDELCGNLNARFVVNSATDQREQADRFLLSYFFALDEDDGYIALHTAVPEEEATVASITPTVPGANWSEREMYDLMGVSAQGHPDPRRLVVPDDWPDGVYPLRCDFEASGKPEPAEDRAVPMKQPPEGSTVVPIGPYFPTQKEPASFRIFVDGETVVGSDYRGFYNHRGVEKLGCSELTYNQIPFIAERICGICGFVHSTVYCQAVEEAAQIEVPRRARYIRTILLELERMESHMLWTGVAGHIISFDTILMQTWRMREPLMWLCERLTGNRKTYGMNLVGGVRRDIPETAHEDILGVVGEIEREWRMLLSAIEGDSTLMARLKDVGHLARAEAIVRCAVGPTARGSGLAIDARVDHPYAAYDELHVDKCVESGCDNLARVMVRLREVLVAIDVIREALETMPAGPVQAEIDEEIPAGREGMSAVEAPRGEVFHWVLTGQDNRPERWRVRAPTYANLQSVPPMIAGDTLADVPIGIGSFDPCFSCTERMAVVDTRDGSVREMTREEIMRRD